MLMIRHTFVPIQDIPANLIKNPLARMRIEHNTVTMTNKIKFEILNGSKEVVCTKLVSHIIRLEIM